jgi:formylmethanofuran dehydrogenase subunit B
MAEQENVCLSSQCKQVCTDTECVRKRECIDTYFACWTIYATVRYRVESRSNQSHVAQFDGPVNTPDYNDVLDFRSRYAVDSRFECYYKHVGSAHVEASRPDWPTGAMVAGIVMICFTVATLFITLAFGYVWHKRYRRLNVVRI